MKKRYITAGLLAALLPGGAVAREAPLPAELKVTLGGVQQGTTIPARMPYCTADGKGATKPGGNVNPSVTWSGAPQETKSYALIVVDRDVPASFELANKPGKTIPKEFKRRDFYHWVLADIPSTVQHLNEGQDSHSHAAKPVGKTAYGINGMNDYAADGSHGGYDGPCPPWNDERLHTYHFIVYALDVHTLGLKGNFGGKDLVKALDGHVVGKGETYATYTTNASMLKK